jgi:SAM-dependent methyltransferase
MEAIAIGLALVVLLGSWWTYPYLFEGLDGIPFKRAATATLPEVRRPFVSFGDSEYAHYGRQDAYLPPPSTPLRVLRWAYVRVVSRVATGLTVAAYLLVLASFHLYAKLRPVKADPAKTALFDEYLRWCYGRDNWYQEPGYFLFKLLEASQFRTALAEFPPEHPSCEFGVWDALVSEFHLKGQYVDVGCEMVPGIPRTGTIEYKSFFNFSIEQNDFPDRAFQSIYLIHVVDHIRDLDAAFKELSRITAAGGRIYFSGLAHGFGRIMCSLAGNQLFNNQPLAWYHELCARHGFDVVYGAYMQAGMNALFFKLTYSFVMRMHAWKILKRVCTPGAVRSMLLPLFLADDAKDKGLNFMAVAVKRPPDSEAPSQAHR